MGVNVNETIKVGAQYNLLDEIEDTDASALWINMNFYLKGF